MNVRKKLYITVLCVFMLILAACPSAFVYIPNKDDRIPPSAVNNNVERAQKPQWYVRKKGTDLWEPKAGEITVKYNNVEIIAQSDTPGAVIHYAFGDSFAEIPAYNGITSATQNKENPFTLLGDRLSIHAYKAAVEAPLVHPSGNSYLIVTIIYDTVPSAPNAPTLTVGDTQLTASWAAPDDGGNDITKYHVQYSSDSGSNWTPVTDPIAGTVASHTITGLTNDGTTSYDVRVRAVNAQGDGEWSASATRTLRPLARQVPKVPPGGAAMSVILSAAIDEAVANAEKPSVTVAGVTSMRSVAPPTVDSSTGVITVSASTTAGTYNVSVIDGTDKNTRVTEKFYVTVSPADNAALKTAVAAGISTWGNTADLNYIITTAITDMGYMFDGANAFNGNISGWNVSSVTNMQQMFERSAFNGDISDWDVSAVRNMLGMFFGASAFNGDISEWTVSSVRNMSGMFQSASSFNGDISDWDVGSVTNMSHMFRSASAFNQNLEEWKDYWMPDNDADPNTVGINRNGTYTGLKVDMFIDSGVIGDLLPSWY